MLTIYTEDMIQFQKGKNVDFIQEVLPRLEEFLNNGNINIMEKKIRKDTSPFIEVEKILSKRFNLNINILSIVDKNAKGFISSDYQTKLYNNVYSSILQPYNQLLINSINNIKNKQDLLTIERVLLTSTSLVDLENARFYTPLDLNIYVYTENVINSGLNSIELLSVLLHEIGHIFIVMENLHNTSNNNLQLLYNLERMENDVKYNIGNYTDQELLNIIDNKLKAIDTDNNNSDKKIKIDNTRESNIEKLADTFPIRFGLPNIGRALYKTDLNKFTKKDNPLETNEILEEKTNYLMKINKLDVLENNIGNNKNIFSIVKVKLITAYTNAIGKLFTTNGVFKEDSNRLTTKQHLEYIRRQIISAIKNKEDANIEVMIQECDILNYLINNLPKDILDNNINTLYNRLFNKDKEITPLAQVNAVDRLINNDLHLAQARIADIFRKNNQKL